MNGPSEQDRMEELQGYVGCDPRMRTVDVALQKGLYIISIGGQDPFWQHQIDRERLMSGDLRVYAKEIVDGWETQRGTT